MTHIVAFPRPAGLRHRNAVDDPRFRSFRANIPARLQRTHLIAGKTAAAVDPSCYDSARAALCMPRRPGERADAERDRQIRRAFIFRRIIRSEEHTSELQSLMRISYAVFCLKKKTTDKSQNHIVYTNNIARPQLT